MKYEEAILDPQCPQWLKDADVESADIEFDNGVIWKKGTWINGTWRDGTWLDGTWKDGTWRGGIWFNGTWRDGTWGNGTWTCGAWASGTWHGGTWKDGIWDYGTWKSGTWKSGTWKDGTWLGGTWLGGTRCCGTWKGGYTAPACRWLVHAGDHTIKIGCKEKTIPEWDEWFAGNEEYDTPRDSKAFKLIRANYLAVKAYKEALQ